MDEEDVIWHYPETLDEALQPITGGFFGKTILRHRDSYQPGRPGRISDNSENFIIDNSGILSIWRYPYWLTDEWDGYRYTNRYCLGSDVSEGLGLSYSVCYVFDRLLDEFVARMRSNRVDAYTWADMVYALSCYYERALICVEVTGAGQTCVKRLKDLNANQYRRIVHDRSGNPVTSQLGWNQTRSNKQIISGDLKQYFNATAGVIYCKYLIDEASTWIRKESGELGPEDSKYGDCVIAGGLTLQADKSMGACSRIPFTVGGWRGRLNEGSSEWATL
jgi:hypothetical protein